MFSRHFPMFSHHFPMFSHHVPMFSHDFLMIPMSPFPQVFHSRSPDAASSGTGPPPLGWISSRRFSWRKISLRFRSCKYR
jgi:hypothetical protein